MVRKTRRPKGEISNQQVQCDSGLVMPATPTACAGATTARVRRAATAGDASTTATGAPSTATRADSAAAGIAPTVRAASTLSVGHDGDP